MKNKFLKPALALVLVAAMAVGGSLAYISATTDTYVNTFTINDELEIELTEEFKLNDEAISVEEEDNEDGTTTYKSNADFMPGDVIYKQPNVKVVANDLTEGAYVFVKITDVNSAMTTLGYTVDETDDAWEKLTGVTLDAGVSVYFKKVDKLTSGAVNYDVFATDSVTIPVTATSETYENLMSITVDAYAIQQANLDTAADAWNALFPTTE